MRTRLGRAQGRACGGWTLGAVKRSAALGLALAAGLVGQAHAEELAADQAAERAVEQLRTYSLEDLTNLRVTTVSKRAEPLIQAPAAIYVITADDIRRSGATSLPEALRLAPNLEVARINAYSYAITARGMNSAESANKLLVLVNGRSVYEPIGSGVLWQQVDVVLSNIDRIEVVSGPGGTLWGANAVNGVINVITKSAKDTDGLRVDGGAGDRQRNLALTYGGVLGGSNYRLSLQTFERDGLDKAPGDPTDDSFRGWQGSARLGGGSPSLGYTLVANAYDNRVGNDGGNLWGGDVMGRVFKTLSGGSRIDAQAYVASDDRSARDTHERRDTFNVQAQMASTFGAHEVVWGGEYRLWREYFLSTNAFHFADPRATISLGSLFAQDEWALRPDLKATIGLKLEENSYSGLDWLPNLRLAWAPSPDSLLWAAASRAVRTPNRIERELQADGFLAPSPDFQSETLWAYEAGARVQLSTRASLSVSGFYNVYNDLRIDAFTNGGLPIVLRNGGEGESWGVEAWGTFDVTPWWRLKAGLNTLRKDFRVKAGETDLARLQIAGMDPKYQAQLRSQMELGPSADLDLALRRVGEVMSAGVVGPVTPAYTEADARIGWRVRPDLELSLAGFNLLNDHHLEIDDHTTAPLRTIPRSVYIGLRWGF
jgi:iron complex outermembrane receptor protein